jgi:ketosteroid isomerase-like protein
LTAAEAQPALKANKALVREVFAAFQSGDVAVLNRTFLAAKSVKTRPRAPDRGCG